MNRFIPFFVIFVLGLNAYSYFSTNSFTIDTSATYIMGAFGWITVWIQDRTLRLKDEHIEILQGRKS